MIFMLLLHAFFAGSFAFVLGSLIGAVTPWIAGLSLALGFWFARSPARSLLRSFPSLKFNAFTDGDCGVLERVLGIFVIYVSWRHFAWMLFPSEHQLKTLASFNLGDLPLHLNYIRQISSGLSFPPLNPSFASEPLRYPFGPDLYNALWDALGVVPAGHLFVVGMVSAIATLIMLRAYAGWWGMGAFFLSGGIWVWGGLPKGTSVLQLQSTVDWKNLFLTVFVTQRGMLFALPLGLLLLLVSRSQIKDEVTLSKKESTALGVVWGFFPLFHTHAFLAVSLMLAGTAFADRGFRGVKKLLLSRMALIAYLPATFFVLRSTAFLEKASVVHLSWGWTAKSGELGAYIVQNFGPWTMVPLAIAATLIVSRERLGRARMRSLWIEFTLYSVLWLVFFNLMLAPWAWDNIKVLIWPYLGFARLSWIVLEGWFEGWKGGDVVRWTVAALLLSCGFSAIAGSIQSPTKIGTVIYSSGELANVQGALAIGRENEVPLNAKFAAAPEYNHPLTYFGRLRVLGYDGHLFSHGVDYGNVKDLHELLMNGDANWLKIAEELGVTHIFWGPMEKARYKTEIAPWMTVLPNVSRVPGYAIYAIKR